MALNGRALSAIAIGSVFVWSGIKGWSILGTAKDVVVGQKPTGKVVNPLVSAEQSLGSAPGVVGSGDIVSTAMQYIGHAYLYGGAPGKDASKPWDCSSYVNYIIGVKLGRAIPGFKPGAYDGSSHGPPTGAWGIWPNLKHLSRGDVASGDIIVWVGHMGIAINNSQMVSALNPEEGTKVTPIDGHGNGPIMAYGRLV